MRAARVFVLLVLSCAVLADPSSHKPVEQHESLAAAAKERIVAGLLGNLPSVTQQLNKASEALFPALAAVPGTLTGRTGCQRGAQRADGHGLRRLDAGSVH